MANGNGHPGWWARNDFRLLRFIFALILFSSVTVPLACNGTKLIGRDFDKVTKTKTVTTPAVPGNKSEGAPTGEAGKTVKDDEQPSAKTETTEETTSHPAWAFLMQLISWATMLGVSLWAVVALCREE